MWLWKKKQQQQQKCCFLNFDITKVYQISALSNLFLLPVSLLWPFMSLETQALVSQTSAAMTITTLWLKWSCVLDRLKGRGMPGRRNDMYKIWELILCTLSLKNSNKTLADECRVCEGNDGKYNRMGPIRGP